MYTIREFRANLRAVMDKCVHEPQYIKRGKKTWVLVYEGDKEKGGKHREVNQPKSMPKTIGEALELNKAKDRYGCGCALGETKLCKKHLRF